MKRDWTLHLLLAMTVAIWVWGLGRVGYGFVHHRMIYGYWFENYRPMMRDDVICQPPYNAYIKDGEYTGMDINAIFVWCGTSAAKP